METVKDGSMTNLLVIDVNGRRVELTGWKATLVSTAFFGLFWFVVGVGIGTIAWYIAGLFRA